MLVRGLGSSQWYTIGVVLGAASKKIKAWEEFPLLWTLIIGIGIDEVRMTRSSRLANCRLINSLLELNYYRKRLQPAIDIRVSESRFKTLSYA